MPMEAELSVCTRKGRVRPMSRARDWKPKPIEAAFKMPEEKVQCITRVSTIIMNLLSLAQDKSVPAADDFMPVLVFVSLSLNQSMC